MPLNQALTFPYRDGLTFDARHWRRVKLVTDGGEEVLLDLPKAVAMADGDGLRLGDGLAASAGCARDGY